MVHNGSNYDFKFLIKHIALQFKKYIYIIPENTEKYKTFSFPIYTTEIELDELDDNGDKKQN